MNKTKAYKVVDAKEKGSKKSAIMCMGHGGVEYAPGKFVTANDKYRQKGNHLLAFSNVSDARFWMQNQGMRYPRFELWGCEIRNPFANLPVANLPYGIFRNDWPSGTIHVEEIKLTKRIEEEV